jgi:hypothetical protein
MPLRSRPFRRKHEPQVDREPRPMARLERAPNYSGSVSGIAVQKSEPKRNPALLGMARGEACLLRVPGVCNGDKDTTVACHSNWAEHGKAGARKADDCYSVWGCSACHQWLDQGKAHHHEKRRAFDGAFAWQRDIWMQIDSGLLDATPKERKAVRWALELIGKDRT